MSLQYLKLSQVLSRVSASVRSICDSSGFWIAVEVLKISNGHHRYLELVEYSESRKEIAKSNAMIWNSNVKILNEFKRVTGLSVAEGMKILIRAKPTFHEIYGLSLTIEEINPSFTLGDMESKIRSIREMLIQKNWIDLNRSKGLPGDFFSVAVIAPQDAAGLGDFRYEADKLSASGLCRFDYFSATFQGPVASSSIVGAMIDVYGKIEENNYDALVIIRGGGDKAGLYQLNDAKLSASICRFPIPVMVGIGHERDKVFIEDVACARFSTPSLLISHIKQRIFNTALDAQSSYAKITSLAKSTIDRIENLSDRCYSKIRESALSRLVVIENKAEDKASSLYTRGVDLLDLAEDQVNRIMLNSVSTSQEILSKAEYDSGMMMSSVMSSNPLSILGKGYGYISTKKGVVTKQGQLEKDESIIFNMSEFKVHAKVLKIESQDTLNLNKGEKK